MNTTLIYSVCALICAALLAYTLTPLVRVLAIKIKAIDVPTDGRRMHHKPIPRIGGLPFFLRFSSRRSASAGWTASLSPS